MTNKELLELHRGINQCGNLTGIEFSYAIAKNAKKIQSEVETIDSEIKKIQLENCKKDKKGEPIIENDKYVMKDMGKFDKEYKKLLDIEINIEIHKIKKEMLPQNISAIQMSGILSLIEE